MPIFRQIVALLCIFSISAHSILILNSQNQQEEIAPDHKFYKEYSEVVGKLRNVYKVIAQDGVGCEFENITDVNTNGITKIIDKINCVCGGVAERLTDIQKYNQYQGYADDNASWHIQECAKSWGGIHGINLRGINGGPLYGLTFEHSPLEYENTFSIDKCCGDRLHFVIHPNTVYTKKMPVGYQGWLLRNKLTVISIVLISVLITLGVITRLYSKKHDQYRYLRHFYS